MSADTVLGIDFGSINWRAFVCSNGQRSIVSDEHGNRFINASIYFHDDEIVIGSSVNQLARSFPGNVIYHPLHYLDGRHCCPDCNSLVETTMEQGHPVFKIPFTNKTESIPLKTVLIECLTKIYNLSVLTYHKKPSMTIVAVPSDLKSENRAFLMHCLYQAKIPKPFLLDSHLAVLIQHETISPIPDGIVMIIDLPSNSASCSFMRVQNGLYETLAFQRLSVCLGREVDNAIFQFALNEACRKFGPDLRNSKKVAEKLRVGVIQWKERLSSTLANTLTIESLFDGLDFMLSITKSRFSMLLYDVTKKLVDEIREISQKTAIPLETVTLVIAVGGSSLIPAVQDSLRGLAGDRLVIPQYGQEVVAEGSALHGELRRTCHMRKSLPKIQQLAGDIVMICGSWSEKVVEKGLLIPCKVEKEFVVSCEDSTNEMRLEMRKGEEVQEIGTITFSNDLKNKTIRIQIAKEYTETLEFTMVVIDGEKEIESVKFNLGEKA